jgi:hypothetical protein
MVGRLCSASALALLMIAALARPAAAQGYVSASLLGDIARFDEYDSSGYESSGSGEAIGFALRLGTAVRSRWGVELEFARPSEIETELSPPYLPLLATTTVAQGSVPPNVGSPVVPDIYFPYSYRVETRQRNTTLSASVWIGQPVTRRFALTYLAGIAFGRTTRDIDVAYEPIPRLAPVITIPARTSSSATTYDVGPLVGVEGAIALTQHVRLVPGVRLHGVEGGWLLRPSVGLGWTF